VAAINFVTLEGVTKSAHPRVRLQRRIRGSRLAVDGFLGLDSGLMPNESEPDKKLKIRPRGLDEKEKDPEVSGDSSEAPADASDSKKLKWDTRLRQSGVKFPAKMVSKPLKRSKRSGEDKDLTLPSDEGEPEPDKPAVGDATEQKAESFKQAEPAPGLLEHGAGRPAAAPSAGGNSALPGSPERGASSGDRPDSKPVEPAVEAPPKALAPEGWESSPVVPASDGVAPLPGKPPVNSFRDMLPVIRRRAIKRIRLIYAVAAGLVVVVFFSILFWNLGVGAGIQSSLDEETKERATVSKEFLAELDQALAEMRAGDPDKAVKKLRELEGSKADVASLTYLLAVAALQNGDIPLAEAKTAESIRKHERISDSLALQAVLETQKGADASIKKFGDPQMRSELLLRRAMLADAANPFPMVELATLLRYKKRADEALVLLRGARSRLNPVDSHSVVDVTIELATLQETPDANLPQIADPGKDLVSSFSAAYIAMRNGNFDQAAESVKMARKMASADLFDYLINDPAIRRYANEPKLREFFQ
jgi:tetratricopeptide (TPR) repeat protein